MRRSHSLTAVVLAGSLLASASAYAVEYKPAGCFKRAKLEATLKGERKIPYDSKSPRLETCERKHPPVSDELRRAEQARVAIFVFDVTGSGRVDDLQLIGKTSPWSEVAQKEAANWLFEPLIDDGIGIRRVGVTVAFILEFQGNGKACGGVKAPVIPGIDKEVRICANTY